MGTSPSDLARLFRTNNHTTFWTSFLIA